MPYPLGVSAPDEKKKLLKPEPDLNEHKPPLSHEQGSDFKGKNGSKSNTEKLSVDRVQVSLQAMLKHCEHFINETWNIEMEILRITRNPFLTLNNSPSTIGADTDRSYSSSKANGELALTKFLRAVSLEAYENDSKKANEDFIFGWHGTEETNIESICKNGHNPMCRKGQQYGPGEYFGVSPTASYGYCKGGCFLLVSVIFKGEWLSRTKAVNAILVDNPTDWSRSYCLPLAIINFGCSKPIPFSPESLYSLVVMEMKVTNIKEISGDDESC